MIFFEIRDKENKVIISTIEYSPHKDLFFDNESENRVVQKQRNVFRKFSSGSVRIIGDIDDSLIAHNGVREKTALAFACLIPGVEALRKEEEVRYTILSHNLTQTHAKMQGEVGRIIKEGLLDNALFEEQVQRVADRISSLGAESIAHTMLHLSKRINDLSAQIEGFEMIRGTTRPDLSQYNLKRVLLSFSYPFYDELNAKRVFLDICFDEQFAQSQQTFLDHAYFNVAMHHFMNNLVKYVRPNSKVTVNLLPSPMRLSFKMKSIYIDRTEVKELFKLEYSGNHVGELAGDGIGMFMIKEALNRMSADIEVIPGNSFEEDASGKKYSDNTFLIFLPGTRVK